MQEAQSRFRHGHALLIGGSEAAVLADTLRQTRYGGYPTENIQLLQDEIATAGVVQSALAQLAGKSGRDSMVFIYFAGRPGQPGALPGTTLSGRELAEQLQHIPAKNLLLVLDWVGEGGLDAKFYDELAQGNGRAVMASVQPGEQPAQRPDGQGSLFAYHLQQALRGDVPTAGDGLIRLFDLADYLAQHVPRDNPQQHPLLVATPRVNNFPIALYRGGWQEPPTLEKGLGPVRVQNTLAEALEPPEQALLESMFADYDRVVLKGRFGEGWSGGRVYMVRPVRGERAELPAVLKMALEPLIHQEWAAYERFAQNQVPRVARIEGRPVYVPARPLRWGGLRYQLAGDGQFYTESLGTYCQHAAPDDITYVLKDQLFKSLDTLWRKAMPRDQFPLGCSLDAVLPPNLMLEYVPQAAGATKLNPRPGQIYPAGTELALSDLIVTEVDAVKGELTLDLPAEECAQPGGYRVRLRGVPDLNSYQEGQLLAGTLTGRVLKTRDGVLRSLVTELFGAGMALEGQQVNIPGVGMLPNPLAHLPAVLRQTEDIRYGPIHGDLNLGNVLVEFDHRSSIIHLIDFARAREDWVLHDLLRLETETWTHLVTAELERQGLELAVIPPFFAALRGDPAGHFPPELKKVAVMLDTVRRKVQSFLTTGTDAWDAYWRGLLVYTLGALKFGNLEPLSKQVTFVVAALCAKGGRVQPMAWQPAGEPASPVSSSVASTPVPAWSPTPPQPNLSQLLRELRTLLLHTQQFQSNSYLSSFFSIHEDLSLWANQLPQTNNLQTRVDETVALLREKRDRYGRHALVLLVEALAWEYDERDALHGRLKEIAGRLAAALGTAG